MKHGWLRRTLILLIAAGLCAGMVFYSRREPPAEAGSLTLWYAESELAREAAENLLAVCGRETGLRIEATAFADEAALGRAFEDGAPDLLFCSHIRALRLDEGAGLSEIAEPLPIPDSLADMRPAVGRSFFPVGFRLPVLLMNTALTDGSFDSLEALLAAAGETPFLGCGCWAELLYTELAATGILFSGRPEQDFADPQAAELYNALAAAVFRGGLVPTDNAAAYVRQGLLPCALTVSTALAGYRDTALDVRPLPLPAGVEARYPAELMGFALLSGADPDAAGSFFRWLWSGRGAETAMDAGLLPFVQAETEARAPGDLGGRLNELSGRLALFLLDAGEPFVQNRADCERWMRQTLDLLT